MNAVVVTDTSDNSFIPLIQNSVEQYCEKVGAEPVFITDPCFGFSTRPNDYNYNRFEKLQAYYLFDKYDRILRLDSDVLIHPECPNIFQKVPDDSIGVVLENYGGLRGGSFFRTRNRQTQKAMEEDVPGWATDHFNSGVMLLSSQHRDIWEPPSEETWKRIDNINRLREQCFMNWRVWRSGHRVHPLSYRFNHCGMFRNKGPRHKSWILHYAGDRGKKERNIKNDKGKLNV